MQFTGNRGVSAATDGMICSIWWSGFIAGAAERLSGQSSMCLTRFWTSGCAFPGRRRYRFQERAILTVFQTGLSG